MKATLWVGLVAVALAPLGCTIEPIPQERGPRGVPGAQGAPGAPGPQGNPGAPGESAVVDGSRLKARRLTTPDGARAVIGWYDTQIGADCAFGLAADGVLRCLPGILAEPGAHRIRLVYADTECTKVVAIMSRLDPCIQVPRHIIVPKWCSTEQSVWEVGPPTSEPETMNYTTVDGLCAPVAAPTGWKFYESIAVPATSLVAGEVE